MNKLFKNIISFLTIVLSFSIVIGTGIGFYFLFKYLIEVLQKLPKELSVVIITGTTTIIVAILSVSLTKYFERKKSIEQELREKKIPIYKEFINFILKILNQEKKLTEDEIKVFMINFTEKIIIWGSDEIISKWSIYRRSLINENQPASNNIFLLEDILLEIRKDTGHKNKSIKKGDILGLFINDIDNYLK